MLLQINETTEWIYTSTTILLLGLGTLLAFGVWAWYLVKRENKPFGEIFNIMLVHQNESILVGLTLLIFFAEAVLAATVHPPGEIPPPPFARFVSHLAISVAGITANVTLMKQFARIFEPNIDAVSRTARVVLTFSLFIMAAGIPIVNCMLISAGLGQDLKFNLFVMDWNPFVSEEYYRAEILRFGGDPTTYRPWAAMSYAMKTTVAMTLIHVNVGFVMGLYNLASQDRRQLVFSNPYAKEEKKEAKDDKKKESDEDKRKRREEQQAYDEMPAEERHREEATNNIVYLLRRMRYDKEKDVKHLADLATKALYSIKLPADRVKMAARIAALRTECATFDAKKKSMSEDDKANGAAKLRKKIRNLFESSPSATKFEEKGLGVTLKGKS
jgi:uncharacterized protein YxeA